jgi:hypothetical protein
MNSEPNVNPATPPAAQNAPQATTPQATIDTSPQTVQQEEPHNIKEQLETPLADRLITKYGHWVHKIVVWGLMFQGLRGLYGSGVFIFIEMPAKELALQNGLIGQGDINSLASKIILMMIGAFVSMVFALRLRALKSGTAQKIQTAIGIFLFIANSQLMKFLNSQNSSKVLSDLILKFFQK